MYEEDQHENIKPQMALTQGIEKASQGNGPVSKWFYLLEVVLGLIACGIYVGIYFLQPLAGSGIISPYYSNGFNVSSTKVSQVGVVSQPLFTVTSVLKSIVLNWVMWKAAVVLVMVDMLAPLGMARKLIGTSTFFVLVCAADSIIFIQLQQYSYDAVFMGVAALMALVITSLLFIKQSQRFGTTLLNALVPYLSLASIVAVYWILMPQLMKAFLKMPNSTLGYLTYFYIFPVLDTFLVLFNWLAQRLVSEQLKLFVSTSNNWLLQGYRTGVALLCSVAEVELYYLLVFVILRNHFFNFVLKKSKSDRMNLSMPTWIVAFFIAYVFNFLPVCGIFNITVSKYYTAYVSLSVPLVYSTNPFFSAVNSASTYNTSFSGNIVWFVPLLVWGASTFSQKYHLYQFNWRLSVYNLLGVYLFYLGLLSALSVSALATNAPF